MQAKKSSGNKKPGVKAVEPQPAETRRSRLSSPPETNKAQENAPRIVWQKERHPASDKLAYSVKEAAEALGVSPWYIRDEMALGHLAYSCPRGRQMIPRWELVRYLESDMHPAGQPDEMAEAAAAAQASETLRKNKTRQIMA